MHHTDGQNARPFFLRGRENSTTRHSHLTGSSLPTRLPQWQANIQGTMEDHVLMDGRDS